MGESRSIDQEIALTFFMDKKFDLLINIVDSTNLLHHLYLTVQLIEMKIPIVLVLNMQDISKKREIFIDEDKLSKNLGCHTKEWLINIH